MLGVATQVAAVGTQGVGGDATLDRQVIEVALQLVVQRRPEGGHQCPFRRAKAVGLSIHGASTGRSEVTSVTVWAARIPATAMELTISPFSTIRTASSSGNHRNVRSASSSWASGRPTSVSPVAR